MFKRDDGTSHFVSPEAIARTFATAGNANLCLGIFNACFSEVQAQAVTEHIDFAIGMNYSISDAAARQFAAHFYGALGFGHSLARAFGQAKAAAMLEDAAESQNPQLFARPGLDPDEVILIRPPTSQRAEYSTGGATVGSFWCGAPPTLKAKRLPHDKCPCQRVLLFRPAPRNG